MRNFSLKIEMTWRDILLRVLLVVATTAVIVWFMPRDNRLNFKIEQGKPWRYADLTAPFDFPIYKSDDVVKEERDQALKQYEPYYTLDNEVEGEQVRQFVADHSHNMAGLSDDYLKLKKAS